MERHADGFDDPLPSVHCHIVHGYEDVTSLQHKGSGVVTFYCHLLGLPGYHFSPFTMGKCQLKMSRKVEGWKKEVLILKQVCCFL